MATAMATASPPPSQERDCRFNGRLSALSGLHAVTGQVELDRGPPRCPPARLGPTRPEEGEVLARGEPAPEDAAGEPRLLTGEQRLGLSRDRPHRPARGRRGGQGWLGTAVGCLGRRGGVPSHQPWLGPAASGKAAMLG